MILPSKHLPPERALLTVGSHILKFLSHPKTVSALWEELTRRDSASSATGSIRIAYDWFVLALDLLFAFGAIDIKNGLVARRPS